MTRLFNSQPFFLKIAFLMAVSMMVPAMFAIVQGDHFSARMFFYSAILGGLGFGLLALALSNQNLERSGIQQLGQLAAVFAFLPLYLAIPSYEIMRVNSFSAAYMDMVSALTTTGLPIFNPETMPDALHLWRAQVAWIGGAIMWVVAAAILSPLNIGGFEIMQATRGSSATTGYGLTDRDRLRLLLRAARVLVPTYTGLTLVLWACLSVLGSSGLDALIHAMSVMSTSGISGQVDFGSAQSGGAGEIVVFVFFIFAISNTTYKRDKNSVRARHILQDPEIRLALAIVGSLSLLLFLRHWVASFGENQPTSVVFALKALWGGVFTVASFLTTTGFVSDYWQDAAHWSGLETPGILFMGMALVGGGVATTAGGVKLLRVFSLYLSIRREFATMSHPSSVSQSFRNARTNLRRGAFIAWVFFMLFVVTISLFTMIYSGTGLDFEHAISLSIATLTTTGPVLTMTTMTDWAMATAEPATQITACLAMILGRLEILVVLSLLAPSAWRA